MAAKKKAETSTYVVIKRGMHKGAGNQRKELPIGEELKLTEAQAAARVGKVALKSEYGKAPKTSSVELNDARRQIAQLTAENDTLKAQVDALNAELAGGDGGE
ncbi:MAG: hypothetical protein KAJ19_10480 [Gammaproteobacteria bacterium]|nr:hypothetical protein [Gammaproteobacteria bacterium]